MASEAVIATLRPEHELLLRLARFELTEDDQRTVRDILQNRDRKLDWGLVLDQACRHRVLPLITHNLSRYGLNRHADDGHMIVSHWWLFHAALTGNRERNRLLGQEYSQVIRGLVDAGVPHAIRKGPAIAEHIYPDPALRMTRDLDVLVAKEDLEAFDACLNSLGYTQGRGGARAKIEPFDRRTKAYWEIFLVNRLPFVKASPHAGIDWYVVDPVVNTLPKGVGQDIDVRAVLARSRRIQMSGEYGGVLSWADWVIDLSMHLYEKAVSRYFIRRRKDVCLGQYLDLAALCRSSARTDTEWPELFERIEQYGIATEVYHALHHTSLLYPEAIPATALDRLRPADTSYLDVYGDLDRAPARWSEPFLVRMFNPRREDEVVGESPVPTA